MQTDAAIRFAIVCPYRVYKRKGGKHCAPYRGHKPRFLQFAIEEERVFVAVPNDPLFIGSMARSNDPNSFANFDRFDSRDGRVGMNLVSLGEG